MKNTLALLSVVLLLAGFAYYVINKSDTSLSTINVEDRKFAVPDVDQIGKIFLADRKGETRTFVRTGEGWILNGKYKARKSAMEVLLSTIQRVELAHIPPKAAIVPVVEDIASHGIKVEIYDRKNKMIKAYYVGGMSNSEEETYMIMEGAEQPYAMKLPAFVGGLRSRYDQDLDMWRDKQIFDYEPEEINYVSVEYPKQKSKSFIMERVDGEFQVKPFFDITKPINKPMKKGIAEAYLVGYQAFNAENYINYHKDRDSISQMIPFAIITLKNNKGETETARFHPLRPISMDGTPLSDEDVFKGTKVERYHVDHSNGDYYLVQQRNFGRAFWSYDGFFE